LLTTILLFHYRSSPSIKLSSLSISFFAPNSDIPVFLTGYRFKRIDTLFNTTFHQPISFGATVQLFPRTAPEGELNRFSIITTTANDLVASIHLRMPVIIPASSVDLWFNEPDMKAVLDYMRPYPAKKMKAIPVSNRVNATKNDDSSLIEAYKIDAVQPLIEF
jgi:hypothetical protein